jgi:hypothetical protein
MIDAPIRTRTAAVIQQPGPHGLYFTHKERLSLDIVRFVRTLEE